MCGGSRAAVGAVGRSWSGGRGRAVVVGTSDRKQENRQSAPVFGTHRERRHRRSFLPYSGVPALGSYPVIHSRLVLVVLVVDLCSYMTHVGRERGRQSEISEMYLGGGGDMHAPENLSRRDFTWRGAILVLVVLVVDLCS